MRNKAIMGVQEQGDALIVQARTSANRTKATSPWSFPFPRSNCGNGW